MTSLLITNPTNIRYLTGFVGVEKRDAYLLLKNNKKYLFTTSLYLEAAKKLKNITVIPISREKPIAKELAKLTKTIAFEENDVTVSEYKKLKKYIRIIPTKNRIEKLRMIKRADEIENIRKACALTKKCFEALRLRPGVTESQIAWEIEKFFKERGADLAFSPIVACNSHSSQPHYLSMNDERITMNSLILLDFGARVNGYCADMTRVVLVGKPKSEWMNAYNAVQKAHDTAIAMLKNGERSGAELDSEAKKVIRDAGLPPYSHSLGHNVGLDIHEAPRLSIKKDAKLMPGMVFSIEPGVYIEGQYGIRIEDLVLLKKDSIEILT